MNHRFSFKTVIIAIFTAANFLTLLYIPSQSAIAAPLVKGVHRNLPIPGTQLGEFGTLNIKTNAPRPNSAYGKVRAKISAEKSLYAKCEYADNDCPAQVRVWRKFIKSHQGLATKSVLSQLNQTINAMVSFRSDQRLYGVRDYWASPGESLINGGDCEDIALVKYVSLRALGFAEEVLRIVVLKDTKRKEAHAVLTVKLGEETYVLDSLMDRLAKAENLKHYRPIYSVSGSQRWIHLAVKARSSSNLFAFSSP